MFLYYSHDNYVYKTSNEIGRVQKSKKTNYIKLKFFYLLMLANLSNNIKKLSKK